MVWQVLHDWVRKISWGREQRPTPVELPREFHGQRSLCWVFVAVCGIYLAAESQGYCLVAVYNLLIVVASLLWSTASRCAGFSSWQRVGLVVVARGLSCPTACGIFPDQGSNHVPCIGRQIPNFWTIGEVPRIWILKKFFFFLMGHHHARLSCVNLVNKNPCSLSHAF